MEPTLVVGAVIVDSIAAPTRVLAARRSRPVDLRGMWEFPGGKVEAGESPEDALVREVREELGVTGRVGPEVQHPDGHWPISDELRLRLFLVEADGTATPDDSHDDLRWLAHDDLATVDWLPSDAAAIPTVRKLLAR